MRLEEMNEIPNYVDLTCTNLMLKLKINLKKLGEGKVLEFYSNREQFDNIKKPFSKNGYQIEANQVDDNKYHIRIGKK
ncbi:MAG: hypothetical protein BAJALOKI3v1_630013 [Promethearchaeota archaeon]|nr:MAG: hypothetical protein BAJALOKI3v1_630013 [Candidatus Lokiarchaeota archaeon]